MKLNNPKTTSPRPSSRAARYLVEHGEYIAGGALCPLLGGTPPASRFPRGHPDTAAALYLKQNTCLGCRRHHTTHKHCTQSIQKRQINDLAMNPRFSEVLELTKTRHCPGCWCCSSKAVRSAAVQCNAFWALTVCHVGNPGPAPPHRPPPPQPHQSPPVRSCVTLAR